MRPAEPDAPARPTPLAKVGIALLCGLLLTLVAAQVIAWSSGQDDPAASSVAGQLGGSEPLVQRDRRAGSRQEKRPSRRPTPACWMPSTPAMLPERSSDAATIAQLAARGWHVTDAVHEISEVTPLEPPSGGSTDNQLRLAVVDTLPARPVVDDEGAAGRDDGGQGSAAPHLPPPADRSRLPDQRYPTRLIKRACR